MRVRNEHIMRSRAAKDARVLAKDPEEDNCRLENDVEASRAATRESLIRPVASPNNLAKLQRTA